MTESRDPRITRHSKCSLESSRSASSARQPDRRPRSTRPTHRVSEAAIRPSRLSTREEVPKGVTLPEKYFLSFSTFEPRKNLPAVISAYEEYCQISDVRLPLVLAGSSGWKTRLKIPEKIRSSVYVLQNVTEAEKSFLYKRAFALLFVSFYEGFGFPILEAAQAGAPVISSFATSLSEIGKDFALLVNPLRSSQIAEAMLVLEQDQKFYAKLKNSVAAAAKQFSWQKAAQETLELFKNIKSPSS